MSGVRSPHPPWEYRAGAAIWKVVPVAGGLLAGEERDVAAKTVSFFCVRLDDGSPLWTGLRTPQAWWTGIEATHRGILLLHEYPVPSMPDHRTITAVDAATGRILWRNEELAFAFTDGGSVYASKDLFDRRAFFELDLLTGAVLRALPAGAAVTPPAAEWEVDVEVPEPSDEVPSAVREAVGEGANLDPGDALIDEEMEVHTCYEVTSAEGEARTLREHLFALARPDGRILLREVLCDGIALPAGASFFRAGGRIIYVRDRTLLRSFPLGRRGAA